jgi:hypothetical protein
MFEVQVILRKLRAVNRVGSSDWFGLGLIWNEMSAPLPGSSFFL